MNERFKELANCNERIQNFFETGPVQRAAIEQFAELVVRECAAMAWWAEQYDMGDSKPISKQITEHFGVEK